MKTVISVKVDKDVLKNAREVAQKIRVPLSMVVNNHLRQFALERRIEFREPLIPNAQTRKVIDKAMRDWKEGRMDQFSPAFTNAADMDRYLDGL